MALDASALSALMLANLQAVAPITTPAQLCDALAAAVVQHLKTAAVVDPAGAVPMNVMVMGAPVPVTGTGKLT